MNLNSILKNFKWKSPKEPFGWGDSPDTDWKVICLATIFLIIVVGVLNVFLFLKINHSGSFDEEIDHQEVPTLNLETLKTTAAYYQNKALEFGRIQRGVSTSTNVVDPSL